MDHFKEIIPYRDILTNVLNGRRQHLINGIADKRFLERLALKNVDTKVPDDAGMPIPIKARIDQVTHGIGNLRIRITILENMLALPDEELEKAMQHEA